MRQPHQRVDVHGDELVVPLRIGFRDATVGAEPGVVHQHADVAVSDSGDQVVDTLPGSEVSSYDLDLETWRSTVRPPPYLLQPRLITSGENQRHIPLREAFGEDCAESRAGPGDDRPPLRRCL